MPEERRSARSLHPFPVDEQAAGVSLPLSPPKRRGGKAGDGSQLDLGFDFGEPAPVSETPPGMDEGQPGPAMLLAPVPPPLGTEEAKGPSIGPPYPLVPDTAAEPLRARMLNEFVYCPRLFYYEQVEGLFVENADTERGSAIHDKVDRGRGDLAAATGKRKRRKPPNPEEVDPAETPEALDSAAAAPQAETQEPQEPSHPIIAGQGPVPAPPEVIHSRSASMGSDRLGVVAKMDLIEVRSDAVTPVDYKAGSPRRAEEANELWDADKMQLGLQILILRDNGYVCDEGVIYYRETKQRVRLEMTPQVEAWILAQIGQARLVATSPTIPPPLVNSPKCGRCSLAPVCLPDETRLLARGPGIPSINRGVTLTNDSDITRPDHGASLLPASRNTGEPQSPRRLIAARDDERALYLNTQGYRVGVKSELLVIKDAERVVEEIRLSDVSQVSLFGNIQLSTQAVHELCRQEIPVAWFSMGGWFYGITRGHGLTNVHTRIRQFATAADPLACLAIARKIVQTKIRNHRTLLMRLHVEAPQDAIVGLKEIASRTVDARSQEELLGMEGAAAAIYFKHFAGMIKVGDTDLDDELPGLEPSTAAISAKRRAAATEFTFDFTRRSRRPPADPVNALLSFAYSLLTKDCTVAALAVGFDPYVGFYHQPRHGKPALALDLMEEFRPLIAESTVLTAINNRMITPGHFVRAGDAVNLSPHGRKAFFQAYEQRMNAMINHPVFDYRVSYRRVLELQARLLARHLTGEIPDYVPMVTR